MCIYLVVDISYKIVSSGKCLLSVYCGLPIASLDLIECIYIFMLFERPFPGKIDQRYSSEFENDLQRESQRAI